MDGAPDDMLTVRHDSDCERTQPSAHPSCAFLNISSASSRTITRSF